MNGRRNFYSRSIVFRKQTFCTVSIAMLILLISGQFGSFWAELVKTDFMTGCILNTVPAMKDKNNKNVLNINYINLLSSQMPVLKANEELTKKYATRYSFIKEKEPSADKIAENLVAENVLELDLSTQGITFINPTNYSVDAQTCLNAPLSISPDFSAPKVLIVHTHTSEAYSDSPNARNENQELSVVKVGEAISEALRKNGINTIHDKTRNDYPSYNGSYKKCLQTVEANLQKYPSIEIVLDIHRDYIERDSVQLKPTALCNEGKAAQIMFVVGTDSMGLHHPDWRENLSLAVKLQARIQNEHPNLCRSVNLRTERFNHHTTKGSMIIEVGSSGNTSEEAILSGKHIGKALSGLLNDLK